MAKEKEKDKLSEMLGRKIRETRKSRNLNMSDLAAETGLTVSMISQVERGLISPSMATLKKIGNAMDLPLSYLFDDQATNDTEEEMPSGQNAVSSFKVVDYTNNTPLVKPNQRKLMSPGKGIRYFLLNPNLNGPIEFIYNEYEPGSGTGDTLYTHPGTECGLILSGELQVQVNDKVYNMKEGDSITFDSTEPHSKKNVSDTLCTCVWANTPPWF